MTTDLTTLAAVKAQLGIATLDTTDDAWFAGAITSVSGAIEAEAGRWFASRGSLTRYLDAQDQPLALRVPVGLAAITYLGVASADQPETGGTYAEITRGVHLRGRMGDGWPGTRIELDSTAPLGFPTGRLYCVVKVTGTWGWSAVPARVAQIATLAVVRAFRAKGSGGSDYAVEIGPGMGMKILRDFAPAETEELRRVYGSATGVAYASLGIS